MSPGAYGENGVQAVILSDKLAGPDRMPIPSLLCIGAVHQHLLGLYRYYTNNCYLLFDMSITVIFQNPT